MTSKLAVRREFCLAGGLLTLLGFYARPTLAATIFEAWGYNGYGTLGNGTTIDSSVPVVVSNLSGVTAIAGGYKHSLAVQNGGAYAWGENYNGQVGNGSTTPNAPFGVLTPVAVSGPPALSSGVTAIAGGGSHSLAVQNGGVYAWGANDSGQLGNNSTTQSDVPVTVSGLSSGVTAIAAGAAHSLALLKGGVYAWGLNNHGQLGNNSTTNSSIPVAVSNLSSGVTAISAGYTHSLALQNGGVYAWGSNGYGPLGNNSQTDSDVPVAVSGLSSGVTSIAGGYSYSMAVQNGGVYVWGWNGYGQLGDGTFTYHLTPERIDPTDLTNITTIVANSYGFSSYALSADGTIWDWGNNADGELGLGNSKSYYLTPQHLLPPAGYTFTALSANAFGAQAILTSISQQPVSISAGQIYHITASTGTGILVTTLPGVTIAGTGTGIVDPASVHSNRQLLVINGTGLSLGGSTGTWAGKLDLGNNDLDLPGASLATITNQLAQGYSSGKWNASGGITSASAAADSTRLTALGVIQNNQNGTALYTSANPFDGTTPGASDILVKYTYYGDANLDGKVDGSDYSRIDAAFLADKTNAAASTGWYNGDFNYDGVMNGSDYTLIDNAFNIQGASLSAVIATSTAQIAQVPEPVMEGLLGFVVIALVGRKRNRDSRALSQSSVAIKRPTGPILDLR